MLVWVWLTIGTPLVRDMATCPDTRLYIDAPKYNEICASVFTSIGNWGIFANELAAFAWATQSHLYFDTQHWPELPEFLHRAELNPWLHEECLANPPAANSWSTIYHVDGGWLMLAHNTTATFANATFSGTMRQIMRRVALPAVAEPHGCKLNALFSRSTLITSTVSAIGHVGRPYTAVHVRTLTVVDKEPQFGCDDRTRPGCNHIVAGSHASICREWLHRAERHGLQFADDLDRFVVLVTPDEALKRACIAAANSTLMVVAGRGQNAAHTLRGGRAAAIAAFCDLFMLMDGGALICGGSTFCAFARLLAYTPAECSAVDGIVACVRAENVVRTFMTGSVAPRLASQPRTTPECRSEPLDQTTVQGNLVCTRVLTRWIEDVQRSAFATTEHVADCGGRWGFGSMLNSFVLPMLAISASGNVPLKWAAADETTLGPLLIGSSDYESLGDMFAPLGARRQTKGTPTTTVGVHAEVGKQIYLWTPSNHNKLWCAVTRAAAAVCGHPVSDFELLSAAARYMWQLTPGMRKAVDAAKRTYGISAGAYNAVHIRAGDRLVSESPQLQHVMYNASWWTAQIADCFPPSVPIVFISIACTLVRTLVTAINVAGYVATAPACTHQADVFSWQRGQRSANKAIALLAEIEIMKDAARFMGAADSNIPRLVVKLRGTTAGFTPVATTTVGMGATLW